MHIILLSLIYCVCLLLSPHADGHAGDILFTVRLFLSLCVCLDVRKRLCNRYLRCGLMQCDENWQDGIPGWVAGHLLFWWTYGPRVSPQGDNALDSRELGVTNWPVMTLCLVSHCWLCGLGGISMWGYMPVGITAVLMYVCFSGRDCVTALFLYVVFHVFYKPVSSIVWLVLMMFTALLALLSCGLLGHLLSFHIYLSK